jgi:phosphocarrier protein
VIASDLGLHARPAAAFVKLAGSFDAEIEVAYRGAVVPGRSIMGLMMLAAGHGAEVRLSASGPDAAAALEALAELLETGFAGKPTG